jgi:hypothetical protein
LTLLAVGIGLALRLFDLGGTSFDLDEASSAYYVSTFDRLTTNVPGEIHPPLWYGFLFFWSHVLGGGDVALRASSVLGGVLWIPALGACARRMFDRRTANVALILAAIWPLAVAQSQLVREYAWIPLLATLALIATVDVVTRRDRRSWVLFGLALALVGSVNYQGLALAAGLVVGAVWSGAGLRRVALACGVAAVASVPTILSAWHFLGLYAPRGSAGIGPGSVLQAWSGLVVGSLPHVDPLAVVIAAALSLAGAACGALALGRWWRLFAAAFVFAGIVPVTLAQTLVNYPLGPNYFTALLPLVVLLIARAVASATRPTTRVLSGATMALALAGLALFFAVERIYLPDFRGLAALVERETSTETRVVVAPAYFAVPVERYYRGPLPIVGTGTNTLTSIPLSRDEPQWLIVNPPAAAFVPQDAVEVPTGWWMRLFRVQISRAETAGP